MPASTVTTGITPVTRFSDITPAWMTRALSGRHPGAQVAAAVIAEENHGTTSRARFRLTYAQGSGPETVFVKAPLLLSHRLALRSWGLIGPEPRLLAHADLLPVETPAVYASLFDLRRGTSTIVIEDLTARQCVMHDAMTPLTVDQVASGLEQLARLHGASAALRRELPKFPKLSTFGRNPLTYGSMVLGCHRAMKRISPELREKLPKHVGGLHTRGCIDYGTGPQVIVHGDAHVGNSYRTADGQVGFFDWQVTRIGSWAHDVGYFTISALAPDDRRVHEEDLLRTYLKAASSAGADTESFDAAWKRYRRTPAYGLTGWMATYGLVNFQRADISLTTFSRFVTAWEELGSAEAIAHSR